MNARLTDSAALARGVCSPAAADGQRAVGLPERQIAGDCFFMMRNHRRALERTTTAWRSCRLAFSPRVATAPGVTPTRNADIAGYPITCRWLSTHRSPADIVEAIQMDRAPAARGLAATRFSTAAGIAFNTWS